MDEEADRAGDIIMDKTTPCKVFRAKSVKGIVVKIIVMLFLEVSTLGGVCFTIIRDEVYGEYVNAYIICIAYFIRIMGIVAGSLGLHKVKERKDDLAFSLGINALANIVAFITFSVLIAARAGEEIGMGTGYRMDMEETLSLILMVAFAGLMMGTFPAFCSIALFDWRENVKIKKKKKRGIYIPTAKKLDI